MSVTPNRPHRIWDRCTPCHVIGLLSAIATLITAIATAISALR
ncbi:hypothetical protein AB0M43_00635 [Longispora sp. NPDC051575]